jgi:hypothetical protein
MCGMLTPPPLEDISKRPHKRIKERIFPHHAAGLGANRRARVCLSTVLKWSLRKRFRMPKRHQKLSANRPKSPRRRVDHFPHATPV